MNIYSENQCVIILQLKMGGIVNININEKLENMKCYLGYEISYLKMIQTETEIIAI